MEFCWFLHSVMIVVRYLDRFLGGTMFACGDSRVWVQSTKAPQSKKLREWNDIFYVLWMRGQM